MADSEWGDDFPKDHVHALGVFALRFNALEMALYRFFQLYAPGDAKAQAFLFSSLHNRNRVDFIKQVAESRESREVADAILFALRCFDICCENRNTLLHAMPGASGGEELAVYKRRAGEPGHMYAHSYSLAQLRAAADAASDIEDYVFRIYGCLRERAKTNALSDVLRELPQRPARPDTLSSPPRPKAQKGAKLPPQS